MKDKISKDPSQEQLLDRHFKTSDGESADLLKLSFNGNSLLNIEQIK